MNPSPRSADGTAAAGTSSASRRVSVTVASDSNGRPSAFVLALGHETTTLDPGRTWNQVDQFKWVTRGLIEPPQSYAVHADGSVDFNGATFRPDDPTHPDALADAINKHHAPAAPAKPKHVSGPAAARGPTRVHFRVHRDPMGHLTVHASRGDERTETGLRGLAHLAADGWMTRPHSVHVDPLQRYVEIDGRRFANDESGARDLEAALNEHYVPAQAADTGDAILIRENSGASTGFDVHFWTVRAGTRFEIKGHLSQDKLDILQDHAKCDLLQPGIILRISPPVLYFRRRRPDGGEEPVPGIPDVKYRAISATELQRLLNHPSIRHTHGAVEPVEVSSDALPSDLAAIRVRRRAEDRQHLWLEIPRLAGPPITRAFTHHNLADLHGAGAFRDGVSVHLALDNRELTITGTDGAAVERIIVDRDAPDSVLEQASAALTKALKAPVPVVGNPAPAVATSEDVPPSPLPPEPASASAPSPVPPRPAVSPSPPRPEPAPATEPPRVPISASPPSSARPLESVASEPILDPAIAGIFAITDPVQVNLGLFRQLALRLNLDVQDLLLTLPRVFEDREFEILNFERGEVSGVFELRGGEFYGVYLSHVSPSSVDLVYACRGTHLEWGTDKCVFQAGLGAEPLEHRGTGLRGLAQDADDHFVFVVEPRYREFIRPHEKTCAEALAHFVTLAEWAERRSELPLIWPVEP